MFSGLFDLSFGDLTFAAGDDSILIKVFCEGKRNMIEGEILKTVLLINGCPRADHSRTLKVARAYIRKRKESEPICLMERELSAENIHFLTKESFDVRTGELKAEDLSLAREFASADEIVVAAPFWEFMFPAIVSCYFEKVSVPSVTFRYTEQGSEGLCRAESLTYIYTSGDYLRDDDKIGELYLKRIAKLYGIPRFSAISAQGLDAEPEKAAEVVKEVCQKIENGYRGE